MRAFFANIMKTLLSYPHLPMLDVVYCMKYLRFMGISSTAVSELTGYSRPATQRWYLSDSNISLPAANAVNELAYRLFYAQQQGLFKDFNNEPRGRITAIRERLLSPEVCLCHAKADIRPKHVLLYDLSDDMTAHVNETEKALENDPIPTDGTAAV